MLRRIKIALFILILASAGISQSAHKKNYSESVSRYDTTLPAEGTDKPAETKAKDDEVVRVETDLVTIPVRVTTRAGRPVPDLKQSEFRIFENGEEQQIAYFAADEAPFTVALLLDMSYSSVFKLNDIQSAAMQFIAQLKPRDQVMIVAFDERVRVLCDITDNRRALRYAVEGARIGSGTSVYDAMDQVLNERFSKLPGRKAIVLLSDGVDTTSKLSNYQKIVADVSETDTLIYPIQYDTYEDVQRNRRKDAPILYDDDDRPYVVDTYQTKGERAEDYQRAKEFLQTAATSTGGRVQKVNSTTNLSEAFTRIADELRKTYSLGYYPSSDRRSGMQYFIRVRVYRPDLVIRARETYLKPRSRI